MGRPKIACQLIVFRGRDREDLPGVLKEVAEAGYAGIEGTAPGVMNTGELRRLMDSLGLQLAGVHCGFAALDELDSNLSYMKEMDSKLLMVSGVGDAKRGLVAYEAAAEILNEVGRQCYEEGITLCYHNHSFEFKSFDGVTGLSTLYELTDPEYVRACVDVYWVQHGGKSPAAFLRKHLDRVATVHFKDMKDDTFAEVGQGIVDFASIMEVLSDKEELEWIIVEQDRTQRTPGESITMSRQYIKEELGL